MQGPSIRNAETEAPGLILDVVPEARVPVNRCIRVELDGCRSGRCQIRGNQAAAVSANDRLRRYLPGLKNSRCCRVDRCYTRRGLPPKRARSYCCAQIDRGYESSVRQCLGKERQRTLHLSECGHGQMTSTMSATACCTAASSDTACTTAISDARLGSMPRLMSSPA